MKKINKDYPLLPICKFLPFEIPIVGSQELKLSVRFVSTANPTDEITYRDSVMAAHLFRFIQGEPISFPED